MTLLQPVVVLPVSRPDFHLAVKWLKWARVIRQFGTVTDNYNLIVLPAASVGHSDTEFLRGIISGVAGWGVLPITEHYERPDLGYAAAANFMFRSALETVERLHPGRPMLWVEADTTVTRASWVREIANEYEHCGQVFMGDFHPHGTIPHMTGNAVYGPQWREAAPSLAALPGPNPRQGWDSACAFQTVPQMHKAKTIQQVWICPRFTESNVNSIVRPETALFHRCKDGSLIDVLAARAGLAPIPLSAPLCPPTPTVGDPVPEGPRPPRVPRVQIMIVTCAKDMEFLRYCLKSVRQFAHGFAGVTLVVPEQERGQYDWVRGAEIIYLPEPAGKGMLWHEVQICRADELCPNADFIVHFDADVMATRAITPRDFVNGERAISVREHYSKITNQNRHIWKKCVKNAVGTEPEYDYMVRHCQVHPRETYALVRDLVTAHTGRAFDEFVLDGRNTFPQTFCEFNTLGTVGNQLLPDRYQYTDYDKAADARLCGLPENDFQYVYKRGVDPVVEWWSHGTISRYKADCEAVLGGRCAAYYVK